MTIAAILALDAAFLALAFVAAWMGQHARSTKYVYAASLVISSVLLIAAFEHLLFSDVHESIVLPLGLPWIGSHFRLDALSSFFLIVVNLGSACTSLYGIGYGQHEESPRRVIPFYPAFLFAMNIVVIADDAFTFLLSWELMSLASWALVMAHHRNPDNAHAGYVYLVMASVGTLALLIAFGLLAGPLGQFEFVQMREAIRSPLLAASIFALALVGTGSKAGLVPLHVWLPLAHPAAPSHVSALMSGVMTKVAVYVFIRIVFDLLGPPAWWWSVIVFLIGGTSAVAGVLYALMQSDLKRVLAYSTIENIGFIFAGLGLALAFEANGIHSAAALAFTAALFHVFNHSVFKSLLFLGSGAVLIGTGERNLEALGGLIRPMPVTAAAMLVGCAAISALPPLNGFASEWLTLQSILLSLQLPQWALKIFAPATGALLVLAAALAAACFVRVFGIAFLGRARSHAAAEAREVDPWSRSAMVGLAGLCVAVGLLPGLAIDTLGRVTGEVVGTQLAPQSTIAWLSLVPVKNGNSYNAILIFMFIAFASIATVAAIRRFASHAIRRGPMWDCGYPDASSQTQYSAAGFAQPVRRVFGTYAFRAKEQISIPQPGESTPAKLHVELHDLVWEGIYLRIASYVAFVAGRLNHLQFLTIRRYLGLVFIALVALLLVLAIWS